MSPRHRGIACVNSRIPWTRLLPLDWALLGDPAVALPWIHSSPLSSVPLFLLSVLFFDSFRFAVVLEAEGDGRRTFLG